MKRLRKNANSILNVNEIAANSNYIYRTIENIENGELSLSTGQPIEIWKSNDGRNVLINGYHRLVEGILLEQQQFEVVYVEYDEENKEYIDEYEPPIYDELDKSTKYKGLEEYKTEQELDEISNSLRE